mgnify:FL=1
MAVSNVELIVSAAKAINPLRKVQQETKKLKQAFTQNEKAARSVELRFEAMGRKGVRNLKNLEASASRLGKRMRTVGSAVKVAGVAFTAYKAIQTGLNRIESERRLKLVAQGYGEVALLQSAAAAAANKFKISQTEANQALANAFGRLRPLGVSLGDITSTFNGFRTAAMLGGATAAESSAAFTQLSQALGSGALRGDEFRSIAEQAPLVLKAISDETGVAAGQLKEYASQGLLTSEIVIKALKRIEKEGAESLKQAMDGPAASIRDFQNAVEDVASAATETIVPELSTAFVDLAQIIRDLEEPIRFIGGLIGGLVEGIAKVTKRMRRGGAAVAQAEVLAADATRRQLPGVGANEAEFLKLYKKELDRRLAKIDGQVFGQLPPSAANLSGEGTATGTTPIRLNQNKSTRTSKARVDATAKLVALHEKLTFSIDTINDKERLILEHQIAQQEIRERGLLPNEERIAFLEAEQSHMESIIALEERQTKEQEKRAKKTRDAFDKAMKDEADRAQKQKEADPGFQMQKQFEELIKLENQVAAGATAIGNAFSNAFVGVISGAKSAQEGLAEMMQSVAKHFLDMAAKIIAQQIAMILYGTIMKALGVSMPGSGGGGFNPSAPSITGNSLGDFGGGSFGAFAEGGYVTGPTNAVIGEGGEPEYVIPESKMRESMGRYSRGSRGDSVIPASGGGGDASGGGTATLAPIDVRYSVERINSVDYVTADQFQAGMREAASSGAKQGEQRALSTLRQNTTQRRRIGI